jgi:hypothetical protein
MFVLIYERDAVLPKRRCQSRVFDRSSSRCSWRATTLTRVSPLQTAEAPNMVELEFGDEHREREVAERGGFEPPTGCPEPHFQCGAIVH